jgi:hypothetical protein
MKGADGVRDRLTTLLQHETQRKVPLLRTAWDLTPDRLPNFDRITSGEAVDALLSGDDPNWITVINPRLLKTTRVDIRNGLPVYLTRYACRIYVWCKADDWATAIAARDNLALACRLSLLEYPNLTYDTRGDTGYRLHESTYTEEFSEPMRMTTKAGNRVWAGAVIAIDADVQETLEDGSTRPPIGEVEDPQNTITTTAEAVGPAQPLPEGS